VENVTLCKQHARVRGQSQGVTRRATRVPQVFGSAYSLGNFERRRC